MTGIPVHFAPFVVLVCMSPGAGQNCVGLKDPMFLSMERFYQPGRSPWSVGTLHWAEICRHDLRSQRRRKGSEADGPEVWSFENFCTCGLSVDKVFAIRRRNTSRSSSSWLYQLHWLQSPVGPMLRSKEHFLILDWGRNLSNSQHNKKFLRPSMILSTRDINVPYLQEHKIDQVARRLFSWPYKGGRRSWHHTNWNCTGSGRSRWSILRDRCTCVPWYPQLPSYNWGGTDHFWENEIARIPYLCNPANLRLWALLIHILLT